MRDTDLSKFSGTTNTDHVVGETESSQLALVGKHLSDELGTFSINFVGVETDFLQFIISY